MLTKDLLNYRKRKGQLFPDFIPPQAAGDMHFLAEQMLACMEAYQGKTQAQLESSWDELGLGLFRCYPAFKKLIYDRISWQEPPDAWEARRWEWLSAAQLLREEHLLGSLDAFQEEFAKQQALDFPRLAAELYGDLPEERGAAGFQALEPMELIHLYNCAQVQGLLLRARWLELSLAGASLEDKRRLVRSLKFHRLVAEMRSQEAGQLCLRLSGPLSVLEQAQSYGQRLANFFPRILCLNSWQLTAEIVFPPQRESLTLSLSSEQGLKGLAAPLAAYIPEEFALFIATFNAQPAGVWGVKAGEKFIHLGQESYCFPDMTFYTGEGSELHLELFHKWHQGQLEHRLKTVERFAHGTPLLVGVEKKLARQAAIQKLLAESSWFQRNGLIFADFPSITAVQTLLEKRVKCGLN